jgi:hypothetical protein
MKLTEFRVFEPKRHLENCFGLPTREPEPYHRPTRQRKARYFDECFVLTQYEAEQKRLVAEGVPFYLAQAIVLTEYCAGHSRLEQRVREASKL